jgi:hypothetical protein
MLAPVLATAGLLTWHFGYTAPRLHAAHEAHRPLLKLEREVAGLNLAFSEQQVGELTTRESAILRELPRSIQDVRAVLQLLEREAGRLGWNMSSSTPALPEDAVRSESVVVEVPVRVRLKPGADNLEPFVSLLTLLERIPTFSPRIGLMRVAISADEGRWQSVEVGLRFTLPLSHAQATQ